MAITHTSMRHITCLVVFTLAAVSCFAQPRYFDITYPDSTALNVSSFYNIAEAKNYYFISGGSGASQVIFRYDKKGTLHSQYLYYDPDARFRVESFRGYKDSDSASAFVSKRQYEFPTTLTYYLFDSSGTDPNVIVIDSALTGLNWQYYYFRHIRSYSKSNGSWINIFNYWKNITKDSIDKSTLISIETNLMGIITNVTRKRYWIPGPSIYTSDMVNDSTIVSYYYTTRTVDSGRLAITDTNFVVRKISDILDNRANSGSSILACRDGGYLVIQQNRDEFGDCPDSRCNQITKLDTNAKIEWVTPILGDRVVDTRKMLQAKDGSFYTMTNPIQDIRLPMNDPLRNTIDVCVTKIDKQGRIIFTTTYGGNLDDAGNDMIEDENGDIVVCGGYNYNLQRDWIENPRGATWQAWLFKVDKNGLPSKTVGVNDFAPMTGTFDITPNPAETHISVSLPVSDMPYTILIHDGNGRQVYQCSTVQQGILNVDISHLSAGQYYCSLRVKNFQTTKPFVIVR